MRPEEDKIKNYKTQFSKEHYIEEIEKTN